MNRRVRRTARKIHSKAQEVVDKEKRAIEDIKSWGTYEKITEWQIQRESEQTRIQKFLRKLKGAWRKNTLRNAIMKRLPSLAFLLGLKRQIKR